MYAQYIPSLPSFLTEILLKEPIAPYANQNFASDYPTSTTAGDQPQVWPVDPQALVGG